MGASQSPYGAKWFATLTYVHGSLLDRIKRRNPLTGLSGLQLSAEDWAGQDELESQSPYGAKWFATMNRTAVRMSCWPVAIPLRG